MGRLDALPRGTGHTIRHVTHLPRPRRRVSTGWPKQGGTMGVEAPALPLLVCAARQPRGSRAAYEQPAGARRGGSLGAHSTCLAFFLGSSGASMLRETAAARVTARPLPLDQETAAARVTYHSPTPSHWTSVRGVGGADCPHLARQASQTVCPQVTSILQPRTRGSDRTPRRLPRQGREATVARRTSGG